MRLNPFMLLALAGAMAAEPVPATSGGFPVDPRREEQNRRRTEAAVQRAEHRHARRAAKLARKAERYAREVAAGGWRQNGRAA